MAAGGVVLAVAAGGYAIARETSIFAIGRIEVTGGSRGVDAQVAKALSAYVGRSLVGLDGSGVLNRAQSLSTVASATYDRSFPSTLHVMIVPERPVAVLRSGPGAWIVSTRGRVIRPVATDGARTLPRIWFAEKSVRVGEVLPSQRGGTLARTLARAGAFRPRILTASLAGGQLAFHLSSGLEIVLGSPADVALKVAVAERVLRRLPTGVRTIDVSLPSRPVASLG